MSCYTPIRKRNLYQNDIEYKLSRSKIQLYLDCPFCFYLDRKCGIGRPPSYPFTLNSAVDQLLKNEFDIYRQKQIQHPLMTKHGIDKTIIPYQNDDLNTIWRENFKGLQVSHSNTNFTITGAIDDLWINTTTNELIVVDYKATSKNGQVTINESWQSTYKRQMEVYQWLLKQMGYKVSSIGYFVYCNGIKDRPMFDSKLEFTIDIIPYEGNDDWIEPLLDKIYNDLQQDTPPKPCTNCNFCQYRTAISNTIMETPP